MTHEVDVPIVGAGAAGVGAPRRLSELGASALLVEAMDRVGWRAETRIVNGHPFDFTTAHGAHDSGVRAADEAFAVATRRVNS